MNGVLFQAFHWFLEKDFPYSDGRNLWTFLHDEAQHLASIGFNAVWLPPASRGANLDGVGYDVYDHYNVGEFPLRGQQATRYGLRDELYHAVKALQATGLQVYADIVLNHKAGGAEDGYWEAIRVEKENRNVERTGSGWQQGKIEVMGYTKFDHQERNGAYSSFRWSSQHFDSVDTAHLIRQDGKTWPNETGHDGKSIYIYRYLYNEHGYSPHEKNFDRWVDLEKGNYDYLTSCDFDFARPDVRDEMKAWGEWYIREFGFDGVRFDAIKHISRHYIQQWLGHVRWKMGKEVFAVGEYISEPTQALHDYIRDVSTLWEHPQRMTLFDFPLFFKLRQAGREGDRYDLRKLSQETLQAEQPTLAVTFVENHDYEYGREPDSHVEAWFKPLGYAFILLREAGFPCVFFPDYYGSFDTGHHKGYFQGREYLDLLLQLRGQFGLGEERFYAESSVAGWVRMGFVPGAKGAMAVVINTGFNRVQFMSMNTGRQNKIFYHLATIKWTNDGYLVVRGTYNIYGTKESRLRTDESGWGEFIADGGSVSIWIEDGVGLD